MGDDHKDKAQAAIDETIKFAEEVEAHGVVTTDSDALEQARAVLHRWVDTVTGVVTVPAFGRVALVHQNGRQSTITSPELPFLVSSTTDGKSS